MNLHVRKGDTVKILAGKDKGLVGKITAVNLDNGRVVVDGLNLIIKHIKAKSQQQQSSIQRLPGSIDASNVQIVCPGCSKPTRVAKKAVEGKNKAVKMSRACKKCGATLDIKQAKKPDKKKAKATDEPAKDKKVSVKSKKTVATEGEEEVDEKPKKGGDGVTTKNEDGAIV